MKKAPRPRKSTSKAGASKSRGSSSSRPSTSRKKPLKRTEDEGRGSRSRTKDTSRSSDREKPFSEKKNFRKTSDEGGSYSKKPRFSGSRDEGKSVGPKKEFRKTSGSERPFSEKKGFRKTDDRGFKKYNDDSRDTERPKRTYKITEDKEKSFRTKPGSDRVRSKDDFAEKKDFKKSFSAEKTWSKKKDFDGEKKDYHKKEDEGGHGKARSFSDFRERKKDGYKKSSYQDRPFRKRKEVEKSDDGRIRLNKYVANAGICSRREADEFIKTGVVTVNGEVITEMGYKVNPEDKIMFGDRLIRNEKPVYILLNKPKDYITTSKDPQNRKTVAELIQGVKERIYPVGRLDRNTTGLLLFTNDGEMAERLMHPRKKVVKIYHAELDKKLAPHDMEKLMAGLELEDGFFKPDEVSYVEGMDKYNVGLEVHSGKNRIVRRLFEHLGYKVVKLDRVLYAGLTKKGIPRGEWRHLREDELKILKMIG